MRSQLSRRLARGGFVVATALVAGCDAGAHSYLPPAGAGDVYTVIEYAGRPEAPRPTDISVVWGEWRRQAVFPRPAAQTSGTGLVLRLRHYKEDRVALSLRTNGRVVYGPVQGAPPPQWDSPAFRRVIW